MTHRVENDAARIVGRDLSPKAADLAQREGWTAHARMHPAAAAKYEARATQPADLGPIPPHNLLVHVVGYVDHGCAACDWLRAAGVIPPAWCLCGFVDDRGDGTCGNCDLPIMADDDDPGTRPIPPGSGNGGDSDAAK